jgi:hypothetical protein
MGSPVLTGMSVSEWMTRPTDAAVVVAFWVLWGSLARLRGMLGVRGQVFPQRGVVPG